MNITEVKDMLNCSRCGKLCTPPILMCQNGHTICDDCLQQRNICSTCQVHIVQKIANLALEDIAIDLGLIQRPSTEETANGTSSLEAAIKDMSLKSDTETVPMDTDEK